MPSEVPRERLQDIVTSIDRVRAHLKGVRPGAELDDKTRDAVSGASNGSAKPRRSSAR